MIRTPLRLALVCAAGVLALSACSSPEPLPPVVVPPAAPPPPPVAMTGAVVQAAAAYRAYVNTAAGISPAFADGDSVERSLAQAAAYEPKQLLKGQIAYGALVALQSPNFVAQVRTYAVDPAGRRDLASRLVREPSYAQALPNSAAAAGLVIATLSADATRMRQTGDLVKQAAYDVQKQKWSTGPVPLPLERLNQAKVVSAQPLVAAPEEAAKLSAAVQGGDAGKAAELGLVGDPHSGPYTPVVSRALALAALAALGEATDEATFQSLLEEQSGAFCLNLSKLNLYQCLSVAKPYYEDVFCLGQHVLADTAQCLTKTAVVTAPEVPKAFLASAEPPAKKPPAKKAPARQTAAKKPPAKKAPARQTAAKKPVAKAKPQTTADAGPPIGGAASIKLKQATK